MSTGTAARIIPTTVTRIADIDSGASSVQPVGRDTWSTGDTEYVAFPGTRIDTLQHFSSVFGIVFNVSHKSGGSTNIAGQYFIH